MAREARERYIKEDAVLVKKYLTDPWNRDFAQMKKDRCKQINPQDRDWSLYDPDQARKLAINEARGFDKMGCTEEAKAYVKYVELFLANQKLNPNPLPVFPVEQAPVAVECISDYEREFDWSSLERDEALELAEETAKYIRTLPGCESQAKMYLAKAKAAIK